MLKRRRRRRQVGVAGRRGWLPGALLQTPCLWEWWWCGARRANRAVLRRPPSFWAVPSPWTQLSASPAGRQSRGGELRRSTATCTPHRQNRHRLMRGGAAAATRCLSSNRIPAFSATLSRIRSLANQGLHGDNKAAPPGRPRQAGSHCHRLVPPRRAAPLLLRGATDPHTREGYCRQDGWQGGETSKLHAMLTA